MRLLFFGCMLLGVAANPVRAETYEQYVARHKRVQKMMNPMNVPVANVLNDAWNEYPEYADPNNKPAPQKGPKDFYIKSSRDDGRLKTR